MIDVKKLSGVMNLDDKEENILPNQHIQALNIRFYGGANGLTAENIVGNTLITNSYKPAGQNEAIGSFFDGIKQRLIWFNWNSNNRHGIYQYSIETGLITPLLVCFTNSQTDILGFDRDYPVASINIIYTTDTDGDELTWVTRNNRPKVLNLLQAVNNTYGSDWLEQYLDVAKEPPSIPPVCAYEDDATVTVNNLKGSGGTKLYRFKYRFIYDTFQKSTWSSISEMPIPFNYTTQSIDTDQTKNCRIGLIFQTGATNAIKIELAAQENLGVTWGNFFSIKILDKSELSIPSYDSYIWNFYNNEAYDYVDIDESNLDFDRVPNVANTQELLNGNVLVYGGITEGYDPVVPDVEVQVNQQLISLPNTSIGLLATQNGDKGLQTGNIRISLVGNPAYAILTGTNSTVLVTIFNGTTNDFLQAAPTSSASTIADLITQLSAAAVIAGYTVVSSSSNDLVLSRANQVLVNFYLNGNGDINKALNLSLPTTDFSSRENYGLAYYDEKYKNNGVTTSEDFNASIFPITFTGTDAQLFYLSYITLIINHRPPDWARYYQVVRTNNLTKENYVSLVSDRTFKDVDFAYISIEGLARYKIQYPTSVISYEFAVGDRIKFVCLFNNDKTINTSYGNSHDYEIVGQIENPNIDGIEQGGKFLKIKLPTTSGTFDFGDLTSNSFYFYYIELYTPAKSVANNLNIYHEFSEMFEIGNPHTSTRYHQGNTSNQTPSLSNPATSNFIKGDAYYRLREIRAGAFFKANTVPSVTYSWTNEPVYQQTIQDVPVGTSYTVKNTVSGNTSNLNNWLIKTGLVSATFQVKGKLRFQSLLTTSSTLIVYIQIKNIGGGGVGIGALASITGATNGQILEFNVDTSIVIPPNKTAVIYLQESPVGSPFAFSANSISGQLTFIDTEHDFTIGVVDPNFSDFFESKVNSNGRPLVVNPDEKELFYPTLLRWGLSYQQNTNINQINRFFPANFDEIDRSKGDIQRFKTRDRVLRVFQNRAVGQYGVLAKYLQSTSGDVTVTTTNDILTKGNVSYYSGEYGLGTEYTGLVSANRVDYFADPVRGYQMRLSDDGFTPISLLYKGQFYLRSLLIPYNKTYLRSNGATAKILGCYNFIDEEWVMLLQGGTNGSSTIPNKAISFNEPRNGYCSEYSYDQAEWLISCEDVIFSFKDGDLWIHNNTTDYCNFFGSQYDASLTVVFNINLLEKKTWLSITELASAIWDCPIIYTNVKSYQNQRQESMLGDYHFATLEDMFHAAFRRDINSRGGINNGQVLKGNYIVVKFNKTNASDLITLSETSIKYIDSPLTNK